MARPAPTPLSGLLFSVASAGALFSTYSGLGHAATPSKRSRLVEALSAETGLPAERDAPVEATATPAELASDETALSAAYYDPRNWDELPANSARAPVAQRRPPSASNFDPSSVTSSYRLPYLAPDPEAVRVQIHGEYQVRFAGLSDLELLGAPDATGRQRFDSLGQTSRLYHWLRVRPRVDWFDRFSVVAALDAPYGLFLGDKTRDVDAASEPLDDAQPVRAEPRWLYVEWRHPTARLRFGQQPFHLGMGLIANDGDHPNLFGDYQRGDRVERIELGFKPLGARSPWLVEVAGDLVFSDASADLRDGDRALETVLRSVHRRRNLRTELSLIYRHQTHSSTPGMKETLFTLDATGEVHAPTPGVSGFVFAEYELVYRVGSVQPALTLPKERVTAYGGAVRFGVVLRKTVTSRAREKRAWDRLHGALELGWASGDSNPLDRTRQVLAFHPNHNVGLLLFDEVVAWKSARAATLASRQAGRVERPRLVTNGGVAGAAYLNPVVVFRPVRVLALRGGVVLGQATADFVDPTNLDPTARLNYDGGSPRRRDLGLELDGGIEYRIPLEHATELDLGAEGGVLFPGHAFDDAIGQALGVQTILVGRFGIQF